jgi:hypothetical protein
MIRRLILALPLAAPLALAACTANDPLIKFAAGDIATAAAVANSPSVPPVPAVAGAVDPSGYQCWGTLEPSVAAIQGGKMIGLATMIEVARVAIIQARRGGACGALASPLLAQLALVPGASQALAIAATSVQ